MPVVRSVRRSRRLSRHSPQTEDGWETFELLYPNSELQSRTRSNPSPPSPSEQSSLCDEQSTYAPITIPSLPNLNFTHSTSASHSRKRNDGHIPRPPNAFMIFRSDLWAKQKLKASVERDHRHVSRIAGHCWNSLSEAERAPYRKKAEIAKALHAQKYPDYKYAPVYRKLKGSKRKVRRDGEHEDDRCRKLASLLVKGVEGDELEKAAERMEREEEDETEDEPEIKTPGPFEELPAMSSSLSQKQSRPSRSRTTHKVQKPCFRLPPIPNIVVKNSERLVKVEYPSSPELTFPTSNAPPQFPNTSVADDFVPTADIPHLDLDNSFIMGMKVTPAHGDEYASPYDLLDQLRVAPTCGTHLGVKPQAVHSIDTYTLANYGTMSVPRNEHQQPFYAPSPIMKLDDFFNPFFDFSSYSPDYQQTLADLEQMFAPISPTTVPVSGYPGTMSFDEPIGNMDVEFEYPSDLHQWINGDHC